MIRGIGIDFTCCHDIERAITDHTRFMNRVFTVREQNYCGGKRKQYDSFTGKYCAKEAVVKALSLDISTAALRDIEILNDEYSGAPYVVLHGELKELSEAKKLKNIVISITHDADYAAAFAVVED